VFLAQSTFSYWTVHVNRAQAVLRDFERKQRYQRLPKPGCKSSREVLELNQHPPKYANYLIVLEKASGLGFE